LVMVIVEGDKGAKKKNIIVTMKEVSLQNGKPLVKNVINDYPFPDYKDELHYGNGDQTARNYEPKHIGEHTEYK